jgi:hypothetical protein
MQLHIPSVLGQYIEPYQVVRGAKQQCLDLDTYLLALEDTQYTADPVRIHALLFLLVDFCLRAFQRDVFESIQSIILADSREAAPVGSIPLCRGGPGSPSGQVDRVKNNHGHSHSIASYTFWPFRFPLQAICVYYPGPPFYSMVKLHFRSTLYGRDSNNLTPMALIGNLGSWEAVLSIARGTQPRYPRLRFFSQPVVRIPSIVITISTHVRSRTGQNTADSVGMTEAGRRNAHQHFSFPGLGNGYIMFKPVIGICTVAHREGRSVLGRCLVWIVSQSPSYLHET